MTDQIESYEDVISDKIKPFGLWQGSLFVLMMFPMSITLDLVLVIINIHPPHFYRLCDAPISSNLTNSNTNTSSFLILPCETNAIEKLSASTIWTGNNHSVNRKDFSAEDVTGQCSLSGYVYSRSRDEWVGTLVEEFDLVCDRAYLSSLSLSMFMIGQIVACFIIGILADIYGRKIIIQVFAFLQFILAVIVAFSPNIYVFLTIQFLIGFSVLSSFNTCFILLMEITNSKWRSLFAMMITIDTGIFGVSMMIMAGYLAQNWKIVYICLALLLLPNLSFPFFIPESPRWLLVQNRRTEALELLNHAAQVNNRLKRERPEYKQRETELKKFVDNFCLAASSQIGHIEDSSNCELSDDTRISFLTSWKTFIDIFLIPVTRRRILPIMLIWFLSAVVYYGCLLNSVRIGGNVYLILWATGTSVAPASMTRYILNKKFASKTIITALFLLNFLIFLCIFVLEIFRNEENSQTIVIISSLIGAFVMEVVIAMVYAYSPELFPTKFRNYSLGICTAASRIASSLTPFIIQYSEQLWRPSTMLIFACVLIVGTFISLILPDIRGKSMPDTVEQLMLQKRSAPEMKANSISEELEILSPVEIVK